MKRDMDLVRSILIELSEASGELDAKAFVDDEHDFQNVAYHFDIMNQAGLIESSVHKAFGGEYVSASAEQLTWMGNDFLASISKNDIWKQVKLEIAKKSVDAPFSVVAALATKICASQFGL